VGYDRARPLIAAPRSGSGKTTITLGLQRALTRRGLVRARAEMRA
jgi:cobyrinic acid a,c-diamide synthase